MCEKSNLSPEQPGPTRPAASLNSDWIQHLSKELISREKLMFTFRTRIGFIGLVGPFIVLGAIVSVFAAGGLAMEYDRSGLVWTILAAITICYVLIGMVGGTIESQGWKHCNKLRKHIVNLMNDPNYRLPPACYQDSVTRHVVLVYVLAYSLMLASALAVAIVAINLRPKAELSRKSQNTTQQSTAIEERRNPTNEPTDTQVNAAMSNSTLILNWVQTVGVICAVFALLFTAYQIRSHIREQKCRNYLDASSRALDLAKMMVGNKDLYALYEYSSENLTKKYEELTDVEKALVNYCDLIIFLCETVWVANSEGWLHRDEWSYWKKWIDNLRGSKYFRWAIQWVKDDYDPDFIAELEPPRH